MASPLHADLGSYVLGRLDAADAEAVRGHLDGCESCRREYQELAGLPALLATVPAADVDALQQLPPYAGQPSVAPEDRLRERLLAAVGAERRRARRRAMGRAGAAAVGLAAAAATVTGVLVDRSSTTEPADQPTSVLVATDTGTGVSAEVSVRQVGWGSDLQLRLRGVSPGQTCSLVAVTRTGTRETTASWAVPEGGYGRTGLRVPGAASFQTADLDRFEVVTTAGRRLVSLPVTR